MNQIRQIRKAVRILNVLLLAVSALEQLHNGATFSGLCFLVGALSWWLSPPRSER